MSPAGADAPTANDDLNATFDRLARRNAGDRAYLDDVRSVLSSLEVAVAQEPWLSQDGLVDRIFEPDRQFLFRVAWSDDEGRTHVNRGFRVQFSGALGPYKGGLRFHPSVTLDVVKFLAFEQTFKNALTDLGIGSGKGGADFDPKGRSDAEVMRFCQAFMTQAFRHLGADLDVPAGDAGVGEREVGWLYGQYKRLANRSEPGVLTGKALSIGGAQLRSEATGFGLAYFAQAMAEGRGLELSDSDCVVSGSGNVAIHAIERLQRLGVRVIACSDSSGSVHDPDGIDVALLKRVKLEARERISAYAEERGSANFREGRDPWDLPCLAAFPCATENEIDGDAARTLVANGVRLVAEGANGPCTLEARRVFAEADVGYGPGKAANAGGVAVSAFEMRQAATHERWSVQRTDRRLQRIMQRIHDTCLETAASLGRPGDLSVGADVAGYRRVAQAVRALGVM